MARSKSVKASIPSLRKILVRFWPLVRKQRLIVVGSILALFGEVAFRVLEPWPVKVVLDTVIPATPGGGSPGNGFFSTLGPGPVLALMAVAIVLIAGARAFTTYLRRVGFALAGSRVATECRGELFSHLQRLSLSFHDRSRTGDLLLRVTSDIGRLNEVAVTAALPLVAHLMTLAAMIAVMFFMDWRLALIPVAVLPLFFLSTRRIGKRIRVVARKQRERQGEMGATAAEAFQSIHVVQALSLEKIQERSFTAKNKSDLREGVKARRLSARLIGTADILIACGSAGVLGVGTLLVRRGEMSIGDLIVFLAYLKSALRPIRNLAKYAGRVAKASASAERIIEVLDTTPVIRDRPGATEAPSIVSRLSFEDVTFGYVDGQVAVDGLSLTADRGDVIVFAGPSGAGKSTILNLLLRLYDPRAGRITLNGQDIRQYTIASVRGGIAVVPQENTLFAVSIRDNIAYGAPGASEEEVIAAARVAQADQFISALPEGYGTVVGERGGTLSEGQRQRISIARAAVRAAPILVLDEPTASLDNENNQMVRQALGDLSGDRITFIIAHDLSTVRAENRVVFLDQGRIVEQGTHKELIKRGGRYAAMYTYQSEAVVNGVQGEQA